MKRHKRLGPGEDAVGINWRNSYLYLVSTELFDKIYPPTFDRIINLLRVSEESLKTYRRMDHEET